MRSGYPYEANGAAIGSDCCREEAGTEQGEKLYASRPRSAEACEAVSEEYEVHSVRVNGSGQQSGGEHGGKYIYARKSHIAEAACRPAVEEFELFRRCAELEYGDDCVNGKAEHYAEHQQGRGRGGPGGNGKYEQTANEGSCKGGKYDPAAYSGHRRQCRTEAGSCADAHNMRVGKGVSEYALHLQAA